MCGVSTCQISLDLKRLQILGLDHATGVVATVFTIVEYKDVDVRKSGRFDTRRKKRDMVSSMTEVYAYIYWTWTDVADGGPHPVLHAAKYHPPRNP